MDEGFWCAEYMNIVVSMHKLLPWASMACKANFAMNCSEGANDRDTGSMTAPNSFGSQLS